MKHNLFDFTFLIFMYLFYHTSSYTTASPIINGLLDNSQRFKFHVSIHNYEGAEYEYACSGSIISERYILTAAHCFITKLDGIIKEIFYPRGTTKIIAGTNLRNGPGIERDLIRVFIPLDFDVHLNNHSDLIVTEADIAVAEMSADLGVRQYPDRLAIIPLEVLDPHSNAGVNEGAMFCGFGQDVLVQQRDGQYHPVDSYSTINRFMNVKILGRGECPQFNAAICTRNSDRNIFRTACYGDSGAGLVYGNKLIGVLSSGPSNCNTLEPIVFTRLSAFLRFIREVLHPRGDHSNMIVLDSKPQPPLRGHRNPTNPRPHDVSSSSSAGDKNKSPWSFWPFQAKIHHAGRNSG